MSTKKKVKQVKFISKKVTKPKSQPEVYIDNDTVLSTTELPAVVPITIRLNATKVTLTIGPRDWEWDRKTKKLIESRSMEEEVFSPDVPEVESTDVDTKGESTTEVNPVKSEGE